MLAGGEEDVQFARIGLVGDARREAEELVRGVAHRRHDDDQVVAGRALARDPPGDPLDAVGAGDGRAADISGRRGGCHGPRILP